MIFSTVYTVLQLTDYHSITVLGVACCYTLYDVKDFSQKSFKYCQGQRSAILKNKIKYKLKENRNKLYSEYEG